MEAETSGIPLVSDNRPDNVWGKINLPYGDTATICNKGSVETDHTMLDIDWSLDGEAEWAEAVMAKYGGMLEIANTADLDPPRVAASDAATLLSTILDSPALTERMLGTPREARPPSLNCK